MDLANRAQKLTKVGVDTPAHIDSMTPNGNTDTPGGTEYDITLTISPRWQRGLSLRTRVITMGFLGKLKGTARQAVNPGAMAGERDKIMRINQSGVQLTATVNSMREVGTQFGGGHQIEFDLTVHPDGGTDYQVHTSQSLHDATLQGIAEGGNIIVKVDPEDPQALLVWGPSS